MDILAHTLWTAAGVAALSRHRPIAARTAIATPSMAALPDVLHLLPIAFWWLFGEGTFAALQEYSIAAPGQEPVLPPLVQLLSHHLHCVMHSAPLAGLVSVVLWVATRKIWIPLLGWWLHIVVDVLTHSARYYAVPVLYPFTERGFDGLAWNTPWFLTLNYTALVVVGAWLLLTRRRQHVR